MIHRRQNGFTLVELMTVVVIVAVLASLAVPSYREYMRRASRSEAKAVLLEDVQFLERIRTVSNAYSVNGSGDAITEDSLPVKQSPKEGQARYNIKFVEDSLTPTTFTLIAEPIDPGPMAGDKCGTFTVNELGTKGITGGASGVTAADCWNK
ncbi:MAG TPA: type IV pilin protein [Steroidobacteraceae bacterium]|nr:type IV pilin protein [Steroidobacteraceae bacterium]